MLGKVLAYFFWFVSLFEKRRKIPTEKNSRGKELTRKIPSKEQLGKDLGKNSAGRRPAGKRPAGERPSILKLLSNTRLKTIFLILNEIEQYIRR